jgi:hypothetical protein
MSALTSDARLEAVELVLTELLRRLCGERIVSAEDLIEIESRAVAFTRKLQASSVTADQIRGAQVGVAIHAIFDGVSPQGPQPRGAPRPGEPPTTR